MEFIVRSFRYIWAAIFSCMSPDIRVGRWLIPISCVASMLMFCPNSPVAAWERDLTAIRPNAAVPDSVQNWISQRHWIPDIWWWRTTLQGNLEVGGLRLDLSSGAGMPTGQRPGFTFSHCFPGQSILTLEGHQSDHCGLLKTAQTFRGRAYQSGATLRVQSGWLEASWRRLIAVANFADDPPLRSGYLEAVAGVQIHRLDIDLAGRDTMGAMARGTWEEHEPFPFLGLAAAAAIRNRLQVRAFIKALVLPLNYTQRLHDAGIDLALHLHRRPGNINWLAAFGLRNHQMDVKYGSERFSLTRSGPVLHLIARF